MFKQLHIKSWLLMLCMVLGAGNVLAAEVTDVLNNEWTGISGTTYSTFTGKTAASAAVYAGQCAGGNSSIQLRSNNNNSGIVTTVSGGTVKKIIVSWNTNTANARTLSVYGKNEAYSDATDLYNASNQGTLLGELGTTNTELEIEGDYEFIGFRSKSGALYLDEVQIVWEDGNGSTVEKSENTITVTGAPEEALEIGQSITFTVASDNDDEDAEFVVKSSNENAVTVSGANGTYTLTAVAAGTATITVSQAATENYKAANATFTVTVNKAPFAIQDGVFNFAESDYGSGLVAKGNTDYGSDYETEASTWTAGNVTLVVDGRYRYWEAATGNQLRIYHNTAEDADESTLTLSVPAGYVITKFVITGTASNLSNVEAKGYDKGTWEGSANSVTLTFCETRGRCDVETITVTYEEAATADLTLTVGDASWTSYVATANVYFPTGVQAYTVTESNASSVTLTEVLAVKAGTPVLVEAAKGEYELEVVDAEECDDTENNLLKASDGTVEGDGQTIFALGQANGTAGLYLVGEGVVIPAGKAYLEDAQGGSVKVFDFGTETAIQLVETANEAAPLYNLAGQRVQKATKGLYIQNGRKFIVK